MLNFSAIEDLRGDSQLRITRVLDSEEDVICPMYGLKGRIDVSLEVEFRGHDPCIAVVPLEIKTGRVIGNMEHIAQTSLYTMLLADRFGVNVTSGLLLYTKSGIVRRVYPNHKEIRSLVMARNEMAVFKARLPPMVPDIEDTFLPPTIDSQYKCSRCYSRDACMLYRRVHNPIKESPITSIFEESTAHLSETDVDFFRTWDGLLSREERTLLRYKNELWTKTAEERADVGRCMFGLVLHDYGPGMVSLVMSGEQGVMSVDDFVLLSIDKPVPRSLTYGRIIQIDESIIHLSVEKDIMAALTLAMELTGASAYTFRLDADEILQSMSIARYNLACMFYADRSPLVQHMKECVVDLKRPQFRELLNIEKQAVEECASQCNEGQQKAIERALCAQDYTLIHGMPGTGKTTAAAALIRVLASLGLRVLLCSYTHSAVDTILAKLVGTEVDVLRIGSITRIHPRVKHMALESRISPDADVEAYAQIVDSAQVIASTSVATNDAVFARQSFDVCIVDEASQVTLPACIGPLRFAKQFVMIGDHQQLSPVIRDPEASAGGLSVSLFERLCNAHPDSVVRLTEQYRMNDEIMALSNVLVYNGALKVPPHIAARRLGGGHAETDGWLGVATDPSVPVVFVDTTYINAFETRCDAQVENAHEARIITQILECLKRNGISTGQIGVITPYRQQARLMRTLGLGVEVLTVDQAQGRDWPVVICSLVRSNDMHADGELLRDVRRINVMITRAQSKLIIVGAKATVDKHASPMHTLFSLLDKNIVEADARQAKKPRSS
ncbi:DNA helicase [Malassezia cuniculi]|uniref:DNA replication ATP-dependent helicase/nuclease DNA2 n=1 Tax=Malassezia cuniculi TaxID=948313 RepID=A0AAF0F255_9BASI|nr:DNA helicase [Malassezia cuniculi]